MDGLRGEDFSPDKNLAGRMIKDAKKRPFSAKSNVWEFRRTKAIAVIGLSVLPYYLSMTILSMTASREKIDAYLWDVWHLF
jgi:hypothetical protein